VNEIHWRIRSSGIIAPTLIITPIYLPSPNGHIKISKVFAHSAWWLLEKNAGIGAHIFLDTPQRFSVNLKAVPDVPQNCLCGATVILDGRHIKCCNGKCEFRRNGVIFSRYKIFWVTPK